MHFTLCLKLYVCQINEVDYESVLAGFMAGTLSLGYAEAVTEPVIHMSRSKMARKIH